MTTQCMAPETLALNTTARRIPAVPLPILAAARWTRRILAAALAAVRADWHRAAAMECEFERLRGQARRLYLEQSGGRI